MRAAATAAARIRWSNVPVPEGFVAGTVIAALLHIAHPWRLRGPAHLRAAGVGCAAVGLALSAWATAAARHVETARPSALVTSGPYRFTRNPMYLGWSLMYLGATLAFRHTWMLLLLPGALAWMHREVLREEQVLDAVFAHRHRRYCGRVPRYLW